MILKKWDPIIFCDFKNRSKCTIKNYLEQKLLKLEKKKIGVTENYQILTCILIQQNMQKYYDIVIVQYYINLNMDKVHN